MNFTREPIIETILSPRDGYKLCIKSSKMSGSEELIVDAVEIVSFGQAFFFRGQERPKPFLVPVTDYEIFEVKETRVVLKNVAYERNIKIGGGRDAFAKPAKEQQAKESEEDVDTEEKEETGVPLTREGKAEKKRERRRNRRKKLAEERKEQAGKVEEESDVEEESFADDVEEASEATAEEKTAPAIPVFAQLLPPPPTLISESIARMKAEAAKAEAEAATAGEVTVPVNHSEETNSSAEFSH